MPDFTDKLANGLKTVSDGMNTIDRSYLDRSHLNMHSWGSVASLHTRSGAGKVDRNKDIKKTAKIGQAVVKKGVSAAQFATSSPGALGVGVKAAATGAAASMSATGVGLLITAGAFSVAQSGAAAVSAYKTNLHINGLQAIMSRRNSCKCHMVNIFDGDIGPEILDGDHKVIKDTILPAIINKKKKKLRRKATSSLPVLGGMAAGLETGLRSMYKRYKGIRGAERHYHAEVLARHLITRHCQLAEQIVAELYSYEEMLEIKKMNSDKAAPLIFSKMAST